MTAVSNQLKNLRLSINKSQKQLADIIGTTQQSIHRYESGQGFPPEDVLLWYADYFDVSLDYIFGRTDSPQGKLYENVPRPLRDDEHYQDFVEMCFDPNSAANAKLKETLLNMLKEHRKND